MLSVLSREGHRRLVIICHHWTPLCNRQSFRWRQQPASFPPSWYFWCEGQLISDSHTSRIQSIFFPPQFKDHLSVYITVFQSFDGFLGVHQSRHLSFSIGSQDGCLSSEIPWQLAGNRACLLIDPTQGPTSPLLTNFKKSGLNSKQKKVSQHPDWHSKEESPSNRARISKFWKVGDQFLLHPSLLVRISQGILGVACPTQSA